VPQSYISRTLSIAHLCALLAVVATLAIVVSHGAIGAVGPSVCKGVVQDGSSGSPVGYRLP
jgi:hypothetical protein